MVLKVFAVRDNKAEAFLNPFFMPTRGMAIRAMTDLLREQQNNIARYPDDFVLYELGTWDDAEGTIRMHGTHQLVSQISELMPRPSQPSELPFARAQ